MLDGNGLQRRLEQLVALADPHLLLRPGRAIQDRRVLFERLEADDAAPTQQIQSAIARDLQQPGAELGFRPPSRHRLPGFHEGFLGQVHCVVAGAGHPQHEPEHAVLVAADEFDECGRVAFARPVSQNGIVDRQRTPASGADGRPFLVLNG